MRTTVIPCLPLDQALGLPRLPLVVQPLSKVNIFGSRVGIHSLILASLRRRGRESIEAGPCWPLEASSFVSLPVVGDFGKYGLLRALTDGPFFGLRPGST